MRDFPNTGASDVLTKATVLAAFRAIPKFSIFNSQFSMDRRIASSSNPASPRMSLMRPWPDRLRICLTLDPQQRPFTIQAMSDGTRILDRVQQGDPKAAEELLPLVDAWSWELLSSCQQVLSLSYNVI